MFLLLSLAACATIALADVPVLPSPPVDAETQQRLNEHQRELHDLSEIEGETRVTFRSKWVSQQGIHDSPPPGVPAIQVEATDTTADTTLKVGADIIFGVVKFIHPSIFKVMAQNQVSLGIFSYKDKGGVTVFPEFAGNRDRPECYGTCSGSCANTCTGDGRKYETLAGLATTTVAAVLEDTILCNSRDPYYGKLNVAVHEFAHSLHMGISYMTSPFNPSIRFGTQIKDSYSNAYRNRIWELDSYAMSNEYEYWAEGVGVYLNTDQYASAGGMNKCDGYNPSSCKTESAARYRLYSKDGPLYNALTEVVVNRDPNQYAGLKTCMTK